MSTTPDDQPTKALVNHLALGALGRAFTQVGQSRDIEGWQQLGADLVAKADAQAPDARPDGALGSLIAPE